MKIQPIAPGIYRIKFDSIDDKPLTPLAIEARKWGWYNLKELTDVFNAQPEICDSKAGPQTPGGLLSHFEAMCGLFQFEEAIGRKYLPVTTMLVLGDDGSYTIDQLKIRTYLNWDGSKCYIPVGWGKRILEAVKYGPVYYVHVSNRPGFLPALKAMDFDDRCICELPPGNIPLLDPSKFTEP